MWRQHSVLVADFASKVQLLSISYYTRYLSFRSWTVKRPHLQQPIFLLWHTKNKFTVNSEIYNSRELLKIEKCVLVERY